MKRVAIHQSVIKSDSIANLTAMQMQVAADATAGATLSVFPEDYLYGVLRHQGELMRAARDYETNIKAFQAIAAKYHIALIPGSLPKLRDNKLYNTTVYIDRSGKVITEYDKHNLWLSERSEYQPSFTMPPVFESELGRTALIICWDIMDHELLKSAVKQQAKWVIVLSFWSNNQCQDLAAKRGKSSRVYPISDSRILDYLLSSRVAEYNIGVIFCNYAQRLEYLGETGRQTAISAGRTQIIEPYFRRVGRLTHRQAATLYYDVDIAHVDAAIHDFEIHYGRRSDIASDYPK